VQWYEVCLKEVCLKKGNAKRPKRFVRFQRLMIESIAWEPVNSADTKIIEDVERTPAEQL